jgi:hypothetical protein
VLTIHFYFVTYIALRKLAYSIDIIAIPYAYYFPFQDTAGIVEISHNTHSANDVRSDVYGANILLFVGTI